MYFQEMQLYRTCLPPLLKRELILFPDYFLFQYIPFRKELGVQEGKPRVTKVISLV